MKLKAKSIFIASLLVAIIFLSISIIGNSLHLWSFESFYTLGISIWSVPIEEFLYYFEFAYMSIIIFELVNSKIPTIADPSKYRIAAFVLSLIFVASCFFNTNADLTFYLNLPAGLIIFALFNFKNKLLPQYVLSYLIFLVPFIIINLIRSYWWIIYYDEFETIGFKIWLIPVEILSTGLILMSLSLLIFRKLTSKSV